MRIIRVRSDWLSLQSETGCWRGGQMRGEGQDVAGPPLPGWGVDLVRPHL